MLVLQHIKETHPTVDLNVALILIVLAIELVSEKNVLIHVLVLVDQMLNAR